jgi:hypothetical protein
MINPSIAAQPMKLSKADKVRFAMDETCSTPTKPQVRAAKTKRSEPQTFLEFRIRARLDSLEGPVFKKLILQSLAAEAANEPVFGARDGVASAATTPAKAA